MMTEEIVNLISTSLQFREYGPPYTVLSEWRLIDFATAILNNADFSYCSDDYFLKKIMRVIDEFEKWEFPEWEQ